MRQFNPLARGRVFAVILPPPCRPNNRTAMSDQTWIVPHTCPFCGDRFEGDVSHISCSQCWQAHHESWDSLSKDARARINDVVSDIELHRARGMLLERRWIAKRVLPRQVLLFLCAILSLSAFVAIGTSGWAWLLLPIWPICIFLLMTYPNA